MYIKEEYVYKNVTICTYGVYKVLLKILRDVYWRNVSP